MHILWVKMGGLWPPTAGGRIRSLETLSWLSTRHEVTVVTTHRSGDDSDGLVRRLPGCSVRSIPYAAPRVGTAAFTWALAGSYGSRLPVDLWKWQVPAVREHVRTLLAAQPVDLIVADFLVSWPNLPHSPRVPTVLFEHNVEHQIWRRIADLERRPWRRALIEVEYARMRRAERRACANADLVVTVSEADRRQLRALAPSSRCVAIPTGVNTEYFRPGGCREVADRLVFTGSMDWYPNEDAVLFFADAVLPRVRASLPGATFTIVGRNPGPRVRALGGRAGIQITGTVDDVRPFVDEAALYVVPLRAGGGTRLKIFEALAMGKPVVSTTVGAEGLAVTPGHDIAIADTPHAFADTVVALLRDPWRRQALARAGRRLVERKYSWAQVAGEFADWCEAVRDRAGAPQRVAGRADITTVPMGRSL